MWSSHARSKNRIGAGQGRTDRSMRDVRPCPGAASRELAGNRPEKEVPVKASLTVPWDSRLLDYDFGHDHPLAPVRVELAMELARCLGVFEP
jgi:hypothetical protein